MKYKYTAYNQNGEKIKGKIEATNREEAYAKLAHLTIIDIKPVKHFNLFIKKNIKKSELARLFNMLGLYLKSSIPLIKAISLVKKQESNISLVKFLDYLYNQINEGKSLYKAIDTQNIINIPEYIKNAIKVGEESGKLGIVLIEMSKFLKEEDKILNKISQALIYPLFIIVVSIFMVAFMLSVVVPKVVKVFENLHQNLPSITLFVIHFSKFLKENYFIILLIIILITAGFFIAYKKIFKFKFLLDSFLLKIPILSKIIMSKELGRFTYLTYILVNSGVNYIMAIKLAANTLSNEKIKSIFNQALEYVKEGKKLSTALKKANFTLDESFIQALSLAEETGEIKTILKNLSEIYFEDNQSRINTILSIIEPLLIITVGSIIGFIVTALLLPMTNLNIMQ
jgi:type II secretory pathway component PulF